MFVARALVWILEVYLIAGVAFAVPFVLRGCARLDPIAAHATPGFRVLILPGSVLLWPILLMRWIRGGAAPPDERGSHRDATSEGT